jgi:hypothetical protein
MIGTEAKAIAAVLYHGRLDWSSNPEIEHCKRVANSSPGFLEEYDRELTDNADAIVWIQEGVDCAVVGWLHDAVEDELTTFGALKDAGFTDTQYKALFLLTRLPEDGTYLDYIRCIANADGPAGRIARAVKLADNEDNCTRPSPADKQGMRAKGGRYDKARKILKGEKK